MKEYKESFPEVTLKYKTGEQKKVKINSSTDSAKLFKTLFNADTLEYSEEFIVMFLNRINNTLGWLKVSQGGTARTVVDAKMIFVAALKIGAHSIILAHNHPSGNLIPSEIDKSMTKKLIDGGKLLDIRILDHLIITEKSFYSFADEGIL